MNKLEIRYQILSRYQHDLQIGEYVRGRRRFRSRERALEAAKRAKKMLGYASILVLNKIEYGYELLAIENI